MRQFLITTTMALALAGAAHAQVSTSTSTNADTGIKVGNGASTVRVDGNSTVRAPLATAPPPSPAPRTTRSIALVWAPKWLHRAKVRNSVDTNANTGTTINNTTRHRAYDPATGIHESVSDAASGVTGSVADTIKSPARRERCVGRHPHFDERQRR